MGSKSARKKKKRKTAEDMEHDSDRCHEEETP